MNNLKQSTGKKTMENYDEIDWNRFAMASLLSVGALLLLIGGIELMLMKTRSDAVVEKVIEIPAKITGNDAMSHPDVQATLIAVQEQTRGLIDQLEKVDLENNALKSSMDFIHRPEFKPEQRPNR